MSIRTEEVETIYKLNRDDEYKTGVTLRGKGAFFITEDFNSFAAKMN